MKKGLILIIALLISGCFELLSLTKIVVERGNAGENGKYNNVNEWHFYDGTCKCEVHKLACWNPGHITCSWMNPPSIMRLIDYAEDQIKQGRLNGIYEEFFDGIRHVVEWNATDINNVNITETVYDEQSN